MLLPGSGGHTWFIIPFMQACIEPLSRDPLSQLDGAVVVRNIAVPVDSAVIGKLAQTFFQAAAF
jgi:hypothetical protein